MTKRLHSILLFFSILFVSSLQAQSIVFTENIDLFNQDAAITNRLELAENKESHSEKVFSYNSDMDHSAHKHEIHSESHDFGFSRISLIDIISSDEGADFNCSGGFCMDKSHFHKKGLTLKKQLFGYFMKISC
ncbi:hypothetical protein [Aquimarina rubra]|uniref:Uncharacterized protein n=1 Tax=Aquimarina rubra TaxID=1920033 RepID=A0ABW5LAI0_9FLAO